MKDVVKFAGSGLTLIMVAVCAAGQAHANTPITTGSTVTLDFTTPTTYQYGNTTFAFSACSASAYTASSCSNLQLIALANGRGGTEIEVGENPAAASDIYNLTTGGFPNPGSKVLNFTLTVDVLAGSSGISSVTNILEGSDTLTSTGATVTTNDGLVSSQLSTFSGVTAGGSQLSNLTTPSSQTTFSTVTSSHSFGFTDQLLDSAGSASSAYTLKLTDVKLLFNPAPEPASAALIATGLIGLTAVRRRLSRRAKQ